MRRTVIVALLVFMTTGAAEAWSVRGHEVVALIAESHLSPAAKKGVRKLLKLEGHQSLAEVALWADAMRKLKLPRQPLHGVRIALEATGYVASRDCPKNGCAVDTIDYAIEALSDPQINPTAKLLELKYLVHLVGDIHQPLHALRTPGDFIYGKKETTLHHMWDRDVVTVLGLKSHELAALVDKTEAAPNLFGKAEDWAWESHVIARDHILPEAAPFRRLKPARLPDDYARKNWPIAAKRLKAAGMRLAWTLNEIYAK